MGVLVFSDIVQCILVVFLTVSYCAGTSTFGRLLFIRGDSSRCLNPFLTKQILNKGPA